MREVEQGTTYVLVDHHSQTVLAKIKVHIDSRSSHVDCTRANSRAKVKLTLWGKAKAREQGWESYETYFEVFTADYATGSSLGYGLTKLDVTEAHTVFFV